MDPDQQPRSSVTPSGGKDGGKGGLGQASGGVTGEDRIIGGRPPSRRRRTSAFGRRCDQATGVLLLFLVVFTPWAFGTTQTWSLLIAQVCGVAMLLLQAGKRLGGGGESSRGGHPAIRLLAVLTVAVLAYTAVSAVNARAAYNPAAQEFKYFERSVPWLPHSYDRGATWMAFLLYLSLAGVFWGARGWLKSDRNRGRAEDPTDGPPMVRAVGVPKRLRLLLWVLCLNGVALALVSIVQRADGSNKLLWIMESRSNKPADSVFGPWSYRSSAAQYFNMVWPLCLGLWLWTQQEVARSRDGRQRRFDGPQILLLPCALTMAAASFISSSRGGAAVSAMLGLGSVVLLLLGSRQELGRGLRWTTIGALALAAGGAVLFGGGAMGNRLRSGDDRWPWETTIGRSPFTLLVRTRLPEQEVSGWLTLAGVVQGVGRPPMVHRAFLYYVPGRSLAAYLYDDQPTNRYWVTATNLPRTTGDREVTLALVRDGGLKLFLDGVDLGGAEHLQGHSPGWDAHILSSTVTADSGWVSEVALVGVALKPAELVASAHGPLTNLTQRLVQLPVGSEDLVLDTNRCIVAEGTAASIASRPRDANERWLSVRRTRGEGYLGFRRALDPKAAESWRGTLRVTFTGWNPTATTRYLAVSVDGGRPSLVELPARGEGTVQAAIPNPRGTAPGAVELAVCDEDGAVATDQGPGEQLWVRDLRVDPVVPLLVKETQQGFRLKLSDRMSGRPEIYANARRMAADHPVWGAGAGVFASLYPLYCEPGQVWAAYAHDDWLELRIELGWVGGGLVLGLLVALGLASVASPGIPTLRIVPALLGLALGGCLIHAKFDLPFRVYSVAFLFVLLAAIVSSLSPFRRT